MELTNRETQQKLISRVKINNNIVYITFPISICRYSCVTARFLDEEATDYPFAKESYNVVLIKTWMVTKCDTDHNDDTTIALCEDTPTRIDAVVPVSDPVSNIHYKNRYCAYCSGVKQTTPLIMWNVKLYSRKYFSLVSEDIPSYVRKTRGNMLYTPPDIVKINIQSCEPLYTIDQCNVTGKWPSYRYDNYVESACESFTNPYNYTYKNIFCFYCNHDVEITGPLFCPGLDWPSMKPYEYTMTLRPGLFASKEDEYVLECSNTQFEDRKMVRFTFYTPPFQK